MDNSTINVLSTYGLHHQETYSYLYAGVALLLCLATYNITRIDPDLAKIPAIGGDGYFSSWLGALKMVKNGNGMILEGYKKHKNGAGLFRVPVMQRWHVVVTSREHTEELLKASDDVLSTPEATNEFLASDYTIGPSIASNPYHINVLRTAMNKNLGKIFPAMHDELVHAFENILPDTDDWVKVPAYKTFLNVIARSSTRVFIGMPKCRDSDYLELSCQYAINVIIGADIINLFPKFLKPLALRIFTRLPNGLDRAMKHLEPIIHERQQKIKEYGSDYPDKPDDVLSWIMDEANGEEMTLKNLTSRVMLLNFASLHTTSMNFVHSLYHLAARPEYLKPLREEIEDALSKEGWSKTALSRMRKLDSFVKESMRVPGMSSILIQRKAMKPYTFSNGVRVPKGAFIGAAFSAQNYDEETYPGGTTFDGFRFSDLGDDASNSAVSTNTQWTTFGHGRHACPGRFFAIMEIKMMLALIVLNYEVKMENEGVRPPDDIFMFAIAPNGKEEVLFRKRQDKPF